MLSGLPEIDLDDWRKNTEYSGYDVQDPVVQVRVFFDAEMSQFTFCSWRSFTVAFALLSLVISRLFAFHVASLYDSRRC